MPMDSCWHSLGDWIVVPLLYVYSTCAIKSTKQSLDRMSMELMYEYWGNSGESFRMKHSCQTHLNLLWVDYSLLPTWPQPTPLMTPEADLANWLRN